LIEEGEAIAVIFQLLVSILFDYFEYLVVPLLDLFDVQGLPVTLKILHPVV
jgi:hypothetical protein